jgi:putative effector of murein hydrolase LrgA (UPF0299 family)
MFFLPAFGFLFPWLPLFFTPKAVCLRTYTACSQWKQNTFHLYLLKGTFHTFSYLFVVAEYLHPAFGIGPKQNKRYFFREDNKKAII